MPKSKKSCKPSNRSNKFAMALSPIPQSPPEPEPISDSQPEPEVELQLEPESDPTPVDGATVPDETPSDPTISRKPANTKRSKKGKAASEKYLAMGEQKLSLLKEKPPKLVPFSVPFTLSKHESLFRVLGLWEFTQVTLEKTIRDDLILQLIAFYDSNLRKSTVNGVRIHVSRADLARALSLPMKKKSIEDFNEESFNSDEAGSILSDFISSYMIFHLQEDDDACILPQEVLSASKLVKEGQAHKVDWAGLIWGFVEKELLDAPKTGICYYASHLQQLIRFQHPKFLELVPEIETETSVDPSMEEEEEEPEHDHDQEEEQEEQEQEEEHEEENEGKTKSLEDIMDTGRDETGLNLGVVSDSLDENWGTMQDKPEIGLRPCSSSGFQLMEFENLDPKPVMNEEGVKDEEEEEEAQFLNSFERLNSSTDLLQAMENVNNAQFDNPNSEPFLSISTDNHNNNHNDSFYYGKRPLSEINDDDDNDDDDDDDDEDEDNDDETGSHFHAKRLRTDSSNYNYNNLNTNNNNEDQSDFFSLFDKAKMKYMQKEDALMNAQMEIQYASSLIQQKDELIHELEKSRLETQNRYQSELGRYEHELNVMAQLVSGYRKALKQTRVSFSEYRKKFPEGEEREKPVYGDVPNGGGLVVGTKELEMMRLQKEMEMKEVALQKEMEMKEVAVNLVGEFEREWVEKFEGYGSRLEKLESKVTVLNGEIKDKEERVNGEDVGLKEEEKVGNEETVAGLEEEKTSLPMEE